MSYRKVSKNCWRYQAVQFVIKALIGKVGDNDNMIYPFDDLVGHGVLVLPYYRRNGTVYALIGSRNYGNPVIRGYYSTLIGYAAGMQHKDAAIYLLANRGGLKTPRLDNLKLYNVDVATIDNEYRNGHEVLTSIYSYEITEDSEEYWEALKCQEESFQSRAFYEMEDICEMIAQRKFGQPHEAKIISRLLKKLKSH
jgi:hypothetical protein